MVNNHYIDKSTYIIKSFAKFQNVDCKEAARLWDMKDNVLDNDRIRIALCFILFIHPSFIILYYPVHSHFLFFCFFFGEGVKGSVIPD